MRLVDAGAPWGFFTLAALHFGGETSGVLAIEPSAAARRRLTASLAMNGAPSRVLVAPAALGAVEDTQPCLTTDARVFDQLVPASGSSRGG